MDVPVLKREPFNIQISVAVNVSLREKIQEYADANEVTESAAMRYILSLFFAGDFGKTQEKPPKGKKNSRRSQSVGVLEAV